MTTIGTARGIDQLGRVVVPAELRRMLGIRPGDLLDIRADNGRLVVRKLKPECALCGASENLVELHDKHICTGCVGALNLD